MWEIPAREITYRCTSIRNTATPALTSGPDGEPAEEPGGAERPHVVPRAEDRGLQRRGPLRALPARGQGGCPRLKNSPFPK